MSFVLVAALLAAATPAAADVPSESESPQVSGRISAGVLSLAEHFVSAEGEAPVDGLGFGGFVGVSGALLIPLSPSFHLEGSGGGTVSGIAGMNAVFLDLPITLGGRWYPFGDARTDYFSAFVGAVPSVLIPSFAFGLGAVVGVRLGSDFAGIKLHGELAVGYTRFSSAVGVSHLLTPRLGFGLSF